MYIVLGITLVLIWFLISRISEKNKVKLMLLDLRQQWGKEKTEFRNFEKIRIYDDILDDNPAHRISDQTLNDIDFQELFCYLDRTSSKIGQQYLFNILKKPQQSIVELKRFDTQIDFFNNNTLVREEIQQILIKLNSDSVYSVSSLLKEGLVQPPRWHKWLIAEIVLLISCFLLSIQWPLFLLYAILISAFNVFFLNYLNKKYLLQFTNSLPQLNGLISVTKKILKIDIPFEKQEIKSGVSIFKSFQQQINILYWGFDQKGLGDISQLPIYLFDLIKAVFLIESFTLFALLKSLERHKSDIINLFNFIGRIDAAISTASIRIGEATVCKPVFSVPGKYLLIKNGIHPLIPNCVPNSIEIKGKGVLLTGSNMSGKTTFLRTLGINSLLAQTLYTCFAEEYHTSILDLYSSIRINDNVFQGKSYFFQEVNVMFSLVHEAKGLNQKLYILDEIFKGTNTVERIAAGKSLLSYLNQGMHIVVASTHDIELVQMLEDEYDLYHFTETVDDNKLYFDHKIKRGSLKTKNAIKILEIYNYPTQITSEANSISKVLSELKIYI